MPRRHQQTALRSHALQVHSTYEYSGASPTSQTCRLGTEAGYKSSIRRLHLVGFQHHAKDWLCAQPELLNVPRTRKIRLMHERV